jgi:5-(carboxyamino)imidazole ribonucleotide synthase
VTHPVTGLPVVGMVGGGQLARMTHEAASALGLTLAVLAERPDDAAALVDPDVAIGAPDDPEAVAKFAAGCDVLTFDHEHVPAALLEALPPRSPPVRPRPAALRLAQDKLAMRAALAGAGFPVPAWRRADHPGDVAAFAAGRGWPVIVKTPRGGYDGRGVFAVDGPAALPPAGWPLLVEEHVAIERELAAVVARRPSGQIAAYPVVQTVQRDGICVEVLAPAPDLPADLAEQAGALAGRLAGVLDVTGVLAVELFQTAGGLLVNELAMRPHNSAHWTIDGAVTSQFEQHLRAVLDWPLGDPAAGRPCTVMVNVLGTASTDLPAALPRALAAEPGARVHLYGKGVRPGRKLGHVTVCGSDPARTRERARRAARLLAGSEP